MGGVVDSVVNINNMNFLVCEWKNFQINNPNEYSTEVYIYNKFDRDNKKILKFHQTLKPVNCSIEKLVLETSLPQLEKRYFEYDFESEKLIEIPIYKHKFDSLWNNKVGNIIVRKDIGNIIWIYRKVLKF